MERGFYSPWVGGSIYHGKVGLNSMGRGQNTTGGSSINHGYGFDLLWVGGSIYQYSLNSKSIKIDM